MTKKIENIIEKIPIVGKLILQIKKVKLPGLEGLTLYDLLEMYIYGLVKGAFSYKAGSIAFSFFIAMFPFALFLLNLIPYIPIENFQQDFLKFVEDSVPPNTYGAIELILIDIMNNSYRSLLSTGVIMSILFMSNGMNALISGFESSYHLKVSRNFFRQFGIAIILSILLTVFLVLSVAFYLTMEVVMHVSEFPMIAQIIRYVFVLIMVLLMVSTLFKFSAKETKSMSFISVGAVFTTILFAVSSYFFGIYVTNFAKYNELYGSIGTLLVIMIYIWINCMILLLGFDLNATIYRLKQKKNYISIRNQQNI